ncbi:MAG: phage/plasmid primase, P4 family [Clostridium sp.]|nr:phage/plasmid primase, P4 family [Clostridium sp.]
MNTKDKEKQLDKLLDLLEIDFNEDKTFVLCGARRDYNGRKGIDTLEKEEADADYIYKELKKRIGNKLYTYEEALKSLKNSFCARIGLWIPKSYIVIDTDTKEASEKVLQYIKDKKIDTPIITTKKGYHIIFKNGLEIDKQLVNKPIKLGCNVDYRIGNKGYIILPINDDDRRIEHLGNKIESITNSLSPLEEDIKVGNKKKNVSNKKNSSKDLETQNDTEKTVKKGKRNDTLFKYLCKFSRNNELRKYEVLLNLALGFNQIKCNPPLDIEEVKTITKSVIENYTQPIFLNEKGNVIPGVLADEVENDYQYKCYRKSDYLYNNKYYKKIEDKEIILGIIEKYIKETGNDMLIRTSTLEEVLKILKIRNTISQDFKASYICVENGLVDLNTFEVKDHTPKEITFFKVPCIFTSIEEGLKKLKGSRFEQYLNTTFQNNKEIIDNIQEIMGMSLAPNPKKYAKAVCLLGEGSNGKSLFINILKALHGDIVSTVSLKDIDGKGEQNFNLYNMIGRNINIDADASGARLEDTGNFKKIITADPIQCVKKGEQATTVVLNILLVFGLNKMPSSSDKSFGFARRLDIIPFNQEFCKNGEKKNNKNALPVDFRLEEDILTKEMDIVLAFALEGLKRMRGNNYTLSKCNLREDVTEEYRLNNDSVLAFYEENKNGQYIKDVSASIIYNFYCSWCKNNELAEVSATSFGIKFKKFYKKKKSNGVTIYLGVRTNTEINSDLLFLEGELLSKKGRF